MLNVILAVAVMHAQLLPSIAVRAPHAELRLQVARTSSEQELGLMYVTKLAAHNGMLFVFATDEQQEFWMKNTLIPLDMIFVGADGKVRKVFANVPTVPESTPDDRIPRRGAQAQYVIELAAGEAKRDGIVAGVDLDDVEAALTMPPSRPTLPTCADPNREASVTNPLGPQWPKAAPKSLGALTVLVEVTIAADGSVKNAAVYKSSGNAAIDAAAIDNAKGSTYAPKLVNCVPAEGDYIFRAEFTPDVYAHFP